MYRGLRYIYVLLFSGIGCSITLNRPALERCSEQRECPEALTCFEGFCVRPLEGDGKRVGDSGPGDTQTDDVVPGDTTSTVCDTFRLDFTPAANTEGSILLVGNSGTALEFSIAAQIAQDSQAESVSLTVADTTLPAGISMSAGTVSANAASSTTLTAISVPATTLAGDYTFNISLEAPDCVAQVPVRVHLSGWGNSLMQGFSTPLAHLVVGATGTNFYGFSRARHALAYSIDSGATWTTFALDAAIVDILSIAVDEATGHWFLTATVRDASDTLSTTILVFDSKTPSLLFGAALSPVTWAKIRLIPSSDLPDVPVLLSMPSPLQQNTVVRCLSRGGDVRTTSAFFNKGDAVAPVEISPGYETHVVQDLDHAVWAGSGAMLVGASIDAMDACTLSFDDIDPSGWTLRPTDLVIPGPTASSINHVGANKDYLFFVDSYRRIFRTARDTPNVGTELLDRFCDADVNSGLKGVQNCGINQVLGVSTTHALSNAIAISYYVSYNNFGEQFLSFSMDNGNSFDSSAQGEEDIFFDEALYTNGVPGARAWVVDFSNDQPRPAIGNSEGAWVLGNRSTNNVFPVSLVITPESQSTPKTLIGPPGVVGFNYEQGRGVLAAAGVVGPLESPTPEVTTPVDVPSDVIVKASVSTGALEILLVENHVDMQTVPESRHVRDAYMLCKLEEDALWKEQLRSTAYGNRYFWDFKQIIAPAEDRFALVSDGTQIGILQSTEAKANFAIASSCDPPSARLFGLIYRTDAPVRPYMDARDRVWIFLDQKAARKGPCISLDGGTSILNVGSGCSDILTNDDPIGLPVTRKGIFFSTQQGVDETRFVVLTNSRAREFLVKGSSITEQSNGRVFLRNEEVTYDLKFDPTTPIPTAWISTKEILSPNEDRWRLYRLQKTSDSAGWERTLVADSATNSSAGMWASGCRAQYRPLIVPSPVPNAAVSIAHGAGLCNYFP